VLFCELEGRFRDVEVVVIFREGVERIPLNALLEIRKATIEILSRGGRSERSRDSARTADGESFVSQANNFY
jgi:hypothetical protein